MKNWFLYLLECRSGAYYAGITNDLEARYRAHAQGRGARYTRSDPPVRLLGAAAFPDRASASRAEWEIKQLPRARKLAYLAARAAEELC
ncbi:MAG TPA: GIY-YIG nuclease family protein [Gammaproteobacteria bacterium]|jgi:putative endonuclease|nr:GIY-YIG nuclease family protein [Gammaproteobacteria bacterium]